MHSHWHERMSLGLHPHDTKEHRRERILRERKATARRVDQYLTTCRDHAEDLLRNALRKQAQQPLADTAESPKPMKTERQNHNVTFRITSSKLAEGNPAIKGGINGYSSVQKPLFFLQNAERDGDTVDETLEQQLVELWEALRSVVELSSDLDTLWDAMQETIEEERLAITRSDARYEDAPPIERELRTDLPQGKLNTYRWHFVQTYDAIVDPDEHKALFMLSQICNESPAPRIP